MSEIKKTSLFDVHQKAGAKIIPFAGYLMPVQYSGIVDEHKKVRQNVGIFDVSHMGEFRVTGRNAEAFLDRLTVNDVKKLVPGKAHYTIMCYPDGGIVDDLFIYKFEDHFMMVVNASNIEKDYNWAKENIIDGVKIQNESDDWALIAVQGPNAIQTLQKLTKYNLNDMKQFDFIEGDLAGKKMIISATGYTGEKGFELYLKQEDATHVWHEIMKAGEEFEISPIGLGARDTLRMEKKYSLYGNDIDKTTNPLEAGLGWITKLDKGDFIGKDILVKIKEEGLKRRLITFKMIDKGIPRHNYKIFKDEEEIGYVTSGTHSPILDYGIGIGYVASKYRKSGTDIVIESRRKKLKAQIVKPPFV